MQKKKNRKEMKFDKRNFFHSVECSEKLVIDSDGGADDAAAILLILSSWANKDSKFEVVAITCVNGNTDEPTAELNILKTVTVAKASNVRSMTLWVTIFLIISFLFEIQIRIYGGAKQSLIEKATTDNYFGQDGLGDFIFNEEIRTTVDNSTYAAVALIELAKLYPGQLNVLCLGPLTNIALAAALDPSFMENVKRFYIMGGTVSGIGNKAPGVEFNFAFDPESNFMVLNNHNRDYTKQVPNLLYPWETVLNAMIEKVRTTRILSTHSAIIMETVLMLYRIYKFSRGG